MRPWRPEGDTAASMGPSWYPQATAGAAGRACITIAGIRDPQNTPKEGSRVGSCRFACKRVSACYSSVLRLRTGLNIELNHPPNLERLVIDVIEANLCNQILILLHFSRSTRLAFLCTAPISKIQSKIVTNFAKLNIENSIGTSQFSQENCYFSPKSR